MYVLLKQSNPIYFVHCNLSQQDPSCLSRNLHQIINLNTLWYFHIFFLLKIRFNGKPHLKSSDIKSMYRESFFTKALSVKSKPNSLQSSDFIRCTCSKILLVSSMQLTSYLYASFADELILTLTSNKFWIFSMEKGLVLLSVIDFFLISLLRFQKKNKIYF